MKEFSDVIKKAVNFKNTKITGLEEFSDVECRIKFEQEADDVKLEVYIHNKGNADIGQRIALHKSVA